MREAGKEEGKSRPRPATRQCYWSHFPRILLLPVFVMKKEECRVQPLQAAHNINEQLQEHFFRLGCDDIFSVF